MMSREKSVQGDAIPFNLPYVPRRASEYINEALLHPIQQGDGYYAKKVEERIQAFYSNAPAVLLVPSGTAALELSFMLLDLKPGDEVIVPSFTFTSVATAITKFWAKPVFCDIDPVSGCLDVSFLESLINEHTRAISWVNYAGACPNLSELQRLARNYGLPLIEDAAHNFGILGVNQACLTGDLVTFSFHATKNIQCGEGGALIITDERYRERAYVIREKGTNRRAFKTGKVSKYSWVDRGSSYLLSEISSALLMAQLDEFEWIHSIRRNIIDYYAEELQDFLELEVLGNLRNAAHMFAALAPSRESRDLIVARSRSFKVELASHYEDLSSSPYGARMNSSTARNSIEFSSRIFRLPVYPDLRGREESVLDALKRAIQV
jgi:dTDP-4-amino-4,6-dideoxygalactose transaminase